MKTKDRYSYDNLSIRFKAENEVKNNNETRNQDAYINLNNYQREYNTSEEYREYLWNRHTNNNDNSRILSYNEFNGVTISNNGYGAAKTKRITTIGRGGKIAIIAYLMIIGIIILLVAMSINRGNLSVFASSGDGEDINKAALEYSSVLFGDEYYESLNKVDYKNQSKDNLLVLTSPKPKQVGNNNWFDSLCDLIEGVVGG